MMDLEIADYERTVRSLHDAVAERDAKVQTLHEELQCREQQHASLQKLLGMPSTLVSCFIQPVVFLPPNALVMQTHSAVCAIDWCLSICLFCYMQCRIKN